MRYEIEEQALPWGMVVVEGTREPLAPLTDPDANGVWTDGGTVTILAYDPVELPVSLEIQREIPEDSGLTRIFDQALQIQDRQIRVGDTTEDTFIVHCSVDTDKARVVVHIDRPNDGSRVVVSIPDLIDQQVVADEVTAA